MQKAITPSLDLSEMKVKRLKKKIHAILSAALCLPKTRVEREKYDCIIVCGYPANENGVISDIMKTRVEKAVDLMKEGKSDCLIVSGGSVANKYIEAEVMADYAIRSGISENVIIKEKAALSTYHNMMYTKSIMEQNEFKNCIVVTNGWHLRKADYYSRKFKLDYVMVKAKEPENEKKIMTIWRYISVNFQMYYMMLKGYY